jgi:GNAT superfamily N-acetyltransferase
VPFTARPLTPERWPDLERLFGERGACAGCWCMYWRVPRAKYEEGKGETNRRAFQRLVRKGPAPGVLGYMDGTPAGWCAVGPRGSFPTLDRSRTLKPIDDRPVWAVTCFFVARPWRRRGLSVELLRAAVRFAGSQGATVVEGYPSVARTGHMADAFAWTGLVGTFDRAGFHEAARPSDARRIMRVELSGRR